VEGLPETSDLFYYQLSGKYRFLPFLYYAREKVILLEEGRFVQIDKLRGKALDQLFDAILSLNNKEECYRFFDDLCTINEIQSLSQRLEVARLLQEGSKYHEIEKETGASTATISRVKRCLNYGNDAYKMVLDRLADKQNNIEQEEEKGTGL
jgi:TrpR-related protein YerC/YecD